MARLRKNQFNRWEIDGGIQPLNPYEVTSGDLIYVQVVGRDALQPTRIEFACHTGGGDYYAVDGYPLWDGLRAERNSQ